MFEKWNVSRKSNNIFSVRKCSVFIFLWKPHEVPAIIFILKLWPKITLVKTSYYLDICMIEKGTPRLHDVLNCVKTRWELDIIQLSMQSMMLFTCVAVVKIPMKRDHENSSFWKLAKNYMDMSKWLWLFLKIYLWRFLY